MLGQALFHQCLVCRGEFLIVQLHRATHEQLPLINRQQWQLSEYFVEAHGRKILGLRQPVSLILTYKMPGFHGNTRISHSE